MYVVSLVVHPLLMPTFLILLLYYRAPIILAPISEQSFRYLLFAIALTTGLIPMLSIISFKMSSMVGSIELENRRDRLGPFLFISIFYTITAFMFGLNDSINPLLTVIFATMTVNVVILAIITLRFKISIHAASVMGLVGMLVALAYKYPGSGLMAPIIVSFLSAGLVMTSRLYLNAHTPREVGLGAFVGFFVSWAGLLLFA